MPSGVLKGAVSRVYVLKEGFEGIRRSLKRVLRVCALKGVLRVYVHLDVGSRVEGLGFGASSENAEF